MSVQLQSKFATQQQPYHIYYTLDLLNNDSSSPADPVIFDYSENRNNPFLPAPENYFMSIVRFNLETPTLPVFIPDIALGASNLYGSNQTTYNITLSRLYNGVDYAVTVPIMFQPTDTTKTSPTDSPNFNVDDLTSSYYWIFTLTQWTYMVNEAFTIAYLGQDAAPNNQFPASTFIGLKQVLINAGLTEENLTPNAPFFDFNPNSLTWILSGDVGSNTVSGYSTNQQGGRAYTAGTLQAEPIKIYFNTPLATLYQTFPTIFNGYNTANKKDQQLILYNNYGTNLFTLNAPYNYTAIQVNQEGTTAALFNPVQSIIFQSTLLPIVKEQVGVPKISVGGLALGQFTQGNNSNINPVITDFIVPFSALNRYIPDIEYTPSGEYRLVDLQGNTPISNINLQVFWKDQFGRQHPFYLGSGCSASVKLLFRRKDFNNANLF